MLQHIEDVRHPAVMPVPSKENDFLGFCASAVKLQNGDKKVCPPQAVLNLLLLILLCRER